MHEKEYQNKIGENRLRKYQMLRKLEAYLEKNNQKDWEAEAQTNYKCMDYHFLLSRYTVDPNKQERRDAHICRSCFYFKEDEKACIWRNHACAKCDTVQLYPFHRVPLLCDACARGMTACKVCGDRRD